MRRPRAPGRDVILCLAMAVAAHSTRAQDSHVLRLDAQNADRAVLAVDRGASGVRQRLLELGTVASVMETTAHPDDEQAGLLTFLSRGTGARTSLLVLNRGEGGANATGDELFDALGLVRTRELLLAGQYYGLDDLYFTSAADYGYSKTLAEATRSWDTSAVLSDMVRAIRQNRPLVVISRWSGTVRDGHGHHQLSGVLTPLAVAAAADSTRFPEQIQKEGLRPWRVSRLFRSNIGQSSPTNVVIDANHHDPWFGMSYEDLGQEGYVRQASQTGGRRFGELARVHRLELVSGSAPSSSNDIFAGLDLSIARVFALTGEHVPAGIAQDLSLVQRAANTSLSSFDPSAPWRSVANLRTGLHALRRAISHLGTSAPNARFMLSVKEQQFERALVAALGLEATAYASDGTGDGRAVTPGESLSVELTVRHAAPVPLTLRRVAIRSSQGWPMPDAMAAVQVAAGAVWRDSIRLVVPNQAQPGRPDFVRPSLASNRYMWRRGIPVPDAAPMPPLTCEITVDVQGDTVTMSRTVRSRQSYALNEAPPPAVEVVPPISLRIVPEVRIVTGPGERETNVAVEVTGNDPHGVDAEVALPPTSIRASLHVHLSLGERQTWSFPAALPASADSLRLHATASVGGRVWSDQVRVIAHAGLEPSYLYADPSALIRRVDVRLAAGLTVGYVMGVGDLVPDAIAELGSRVILLDAATVAAGDFSRFDAIVIGTRAYSVRPELHGASAALRRYAMAGGQVVVLYQTPDADLASAAPFALTLPPDAEEISEQDAPVHLLNTSHALLTTPNRITTADFDGWIEQRGSKFLRTWGHEFLPLMESHDTGQPPQEGIWVSADVGAGRWTYVALALHRQLPFGVPGAYRILANLLTKR
ncbi:MAG: PIG-L family deacetylase [Gemmatimonadaceae bacterium]